MSHIDGVIGDVIDELREITRDYDHIGDGITNVLCKDSEWIVNLNWGEQEVCRRGYVIQDRSTVSVCILPLITNTALYSISNKILRIEEARMYRLGVFDSKLTKTNENNLNRAGTFWRDYDGIPTEFIEYETHQLRVYPYPDATYGDITGTATSTSAGKLINSSATFVTNALVAGMRVYDLTGGSNTTIVSVDSETQLTVTDNIFASGDSYRVAKTYLELDVRRLPLTDISMSNTTPTIDSRYYEAMKIAALYKFYTKRDIEAKDYPQAAYYEKKLTELVGPSRNYNSERISKTDPDILTFAERT